MPDLLRQIPEGKSSPGTIYVDSRGIGEATAIQLEDYGFTVIRVYPDREKTVIKEDQAVLAELQALRAYVAQIAQLLQLNQLG